MGIVFTSGHMTQHARSISVVLRCIWESMMEQEDVLYDSSEYIETVG